MTDKITDLKIYLDGIATDVKGRWFKVSFYSKGQPIDIADKVCDLDLPYISDVIVQVIEKGITEVVDCEVCEGRGYITIDKHGKLRQVTCPGLCYGRGYHRVIQEVEK